MYAVLSKFLLFFLCVWKWTHEIMPLPPIPRLQKQQPVLGNELCGFCLSHVISLLPVSRAQWFSCKFWFYFYFFLFKSLFPTSIPQPKPSALRVPCAEGLGAEAAGPSAPSSGSCHHPVWELAIISGAEGDRHYTQL